MDVQVSPNLAFSAAMLGTFAIVWEAIRPGSVAPGLLGCVLLTGGGYALARYPVDIDGLAWMGAALPILLTELIWNTRFASGAAGFLAFGAGSARLVAGPVRISPVLAWIFSALFCGTACLLAGSARRARRNKWAEFASPTGATRSLEQIPCRKRTGG